MDILRKKILAESRITDISPENCKVISRMIFERDKNYLSETTIKRFFGVIISANAFSPFVLNSLCHFAGFENYESFAGLYRIMLQ